MSRRLLYIRCHDDSPGPRSLLAVPPGIARFVVDKPCAAPAPPVWQLMQLLLKCSCPTDDRRACMYDGTRAARGTKFNFWIEKIRVKIGKIKIKIKKN
eukprot:SAG31_NODE_1608_length_7760_cov_3.045425_5_plen_98_part_00